MKLYEILKQNVIDSFNQAKVPGTGKIAPRPGCYLIRKVFYKDTPLKDQIPMAHVNWKSGLEGSFVESAIFEIALVSLVNSEPNKTRDLQFEHLKGRMIWVFEPKLNQKNINGVFKSTLQCLWRFIEGTPTFINDKNLFQNITLPNAEPSKTFYENMLAEQSYDVVGAIEMEGNYGTNDFLVESSAYEDNIEMPGDFPEDDDTDLIGDFPEDDK